MRPFENPQAEQTALWLASAPLTSSPVKLEEITQGLQEWVFERASQHPNHKEGAQACIGAPSWLSSPPEQPQGTPTLPRLQVLPRFPSVERLRRDTPGRVPATTPAPGHPRLASHGAGCSPRLWQPRSDAEATPAAGDEGPAAQPTATAQLPLPGTTAATAFPQPGGGWLGPAGARGVHKRPFFSQSAEPSSSSRDTGEFILAAEHLE